MKWNLSKPEVPLVHLFFFSGVLSSGANEAPISAFNKWIILSWEVLDKFHWTKIFRGHSKEFEGRKELTTAACIACWDESSWAKCRTSCQCKGTQWQEASPTSSEISTAALWQWKDQSVHGLFPGLVFPRETFTRSKPFLARWLDLWS